MDQQELYAWERRCVQEEMPYCRAACPLQVDARAFMERMAAGDTAGGRKVLERHMPLPGLLARICDRPCERACLRGEFGGALALGALEKYCVEGVPQQTKALPIPYKNKSLAVLGDGLAGLTAAWDLVRKGYAVTLHHEGALPGEELMAAAGLDYGLLQVELSHMNKTRLLFERRALDAALLEEASGRFDALFVDAGYCALAPEPATLDPLTLSGGEGRLAYGGWNKSSPSACAGEGRRAASTLERFVSGVSLSASREKEGLSQTRLKTPRKDIVFLPGRREPGAPFVSPEEARAEASRCLRCECMACVRQCAYLRHYQGYPKTYARQIYNNAAIVKGQHLSNSLINGCSLCGQCAELCPEAFSMADLCLASRREMVERGYMPPSAHEFALEDMEAADSPECSIFLVPGGEKRCAHLFFPGCQLAASRGEQLERVYAHLRAGLAGGVGLALHCCGVPARWAGREDRFALCAARIREEWEAMGRPRLIAACASCLKTLRESQPDMEILSLWQVLHEECPEPESIQPLTLSVHDPCAARHDIVWQKAVRGLLARHGVDAREADPGGRETACCGYGGLAWNSQPQVASAMAAQRAGQLEHDALASCVMCRDRLAEEGKRCFHMLDILFPLPGGMDPGERGPGLSARRANRAALQRRMRREALGERLPEPAPQEPPLYLDDDLLRDLEKRHILLEDLRRVIVAAQAEGAGFRNKAGDRLLASWRPVRVTFWVEYSPEEGDRGPGFRVYGAYSHRMLVPGTGNARESSLTPDYGASSSFRAAEDRGALISSPAVSSPASGSASGTASGPVSSYSNTEEPR